MKEDREKRTPAERFEWYKKQMPAAEKYIYMNSGGCGPMPTSVLKSMEDVFERMVQEGQVNVNIHGWLKALLEDVRKSVADFIHAEPEEIFFVRCIAEGLNTIVRLEAGRAGADQRSGKSGFHSSFLCRGADFKASHRYIFRNWESGANCRTVFQKTDA